MSRRKNNISKASAFVLCLFLLGGCSLVRKVTTLPGPKAPQNQTKVENTDRFVLVDPATPKTAPEPKPSVDIKIKPQTKEDKSRQKSLIRIAKSRLGCHYQYAGKGPNSFDCSGFTGYVFGQIGIKLGASSRDQFQQGRPIARGEPLRTGDLVFWNGRKIGSTVGHVGIVVDYDRATDSFTFIHAAVSTGVEIQKSTSEYYARRYMGARRILDDIPADSPDVEDEPQPAVEAAAQPQPQTPQQQAASQPEPVYHTVKSGDTLSALAVKYHTTVSKICSLNGITSKTILKIGRRLRVK